MAEKISRRGFLRKARDTAIALSSASMLQACGSDDFNVPSEAVSRKAFPVENIQVEPAVAELLTDQALDRAKSYVSHRFELFEPYLWQDSLGRAIIAVDSEQTYKENAAIFRVRLYEDEKSIRFPYPERDLARAIGYNSYNHLSSWDRAGIDTFGPDDVRETFANIAAHYIMDPDLVTLTPLVLEHRGLLSLQEDVKGFLETLKKDVFNDNSYESLFPAEQLTQSQYLGAPFGQRGIKMEEIVNLKSKVSPDTLAFIRLLEIKDNYFFGGSNIVPRKPHNVQDTYNDLAAKQAVLAYHDQVSAEITDLQNQSLRRQDITDYATILEAENRYATWEFNYFHRNYEDSNNLQYSMTDSELQQGALEALELMDYAIARTHNLQNKFGREFKAMKLLEVLGLFDERCERAANLYQRYENIGGNYTFVDALERCET
jgi:hypothetical protein